MKLPTTDDAWISTLWSLDGISYREAAAEIGCSPNTLSTRATRHGYRRTMGRHDSSWTEGPCTQCHVVLPVEALSEDRRCDACEELVRVDAMDPPETEEEWIHALWAIDGISYAEGTEVVGWTYSTIAAKAQKYGFRRKYGVRDGSWRQGPCVSCNNIHTVDNLSPDRQCANCAALDDAMDAHRQELAVIHGIDLEAERMAHRQRMRERQAGLRRRLPEPVVFTWPGGGRMGVRMPSMDAGVAL